MCRVITRILTFAALMLVWLTNSFAQQQLNFTAALNEAHESIEIGNPDYGTVPEDPPGPNRRADSGDGANFTLYCFESGGVCLCDNTICPPGHLQCINLGENLERTLYLGRNLSDALFTVASAVTLLVHEDSDGILTYTWTGFFDNVNNIESFIFRVPVELQQLIGPGCLIVFNDRGEASWEDHKIVCWGFITEVTFGDDSKITELRFITRDQGSSAATEPSPLFARDGDNNIIGYPLSTFEDIHGPDNGANTYWNSFRIYLVDVSDASKLYGNNSQSEGK